LIKGLTEMTDLVNRLRGLTRVGANGVFCIRRFADFIPPICLEAADTIEQLKAELAAERKAPKLRDITTNDLRDLRHGMQEYFCMPKTKSQRNLNASHIRLAHIAAVIGGLIAQIEAQDQ
jgi:hypothetical protein